MEKAHTNSVEITKHYSIVNVKTKLIKQAELGIR
jgi:hypothetical protein